jgi:hypothetical protein
MAKDAVATMGSVLPDDAGGRDAVHVAVFSATSPARLLPGQAVGIVEPEPNDLGDTVVTGSGASAPVGIVDPFIAGAIPAGERFWVYLFPRTITALSHRWSHPAFEDTGGNAYATPGSKAASEKWLQDFCEGADCPGYHAVMGKAEHIANGGSGSQYDDEYMHFDGQDAHGEIPPEFWDHVEVVLGRKIAGTKSSYFSCSC